MIRRQVVAVAMAVSVCAVMNTGAAHAGPYSDDLAKCLVESTTTADKNALVKWMFAMAALHPAVKSIASITEAERTQLSHNTAQLFERLLTESCRTQTRQAVKYEGAAALQTGFQMLGQVAARELFVDPNVARGLADLENHIDSQKMKQVLDPAQ